MRRLLLAAGAILAALPAWAGQVSGNSSQLFVPGIGGAGTVPSGSDFIYRTASARAADHVSVMDFHNSDGSPVACDGSHDDTTGVQAAENFVEASSVTNGRAGELDFPSNRTCTFQYVVVQRVVTWAGTGTSASWIKQIGGSNQPFIRFSVSYAVSSYLPQANMIFRDLQIIGPSKTDTSSHFWVDIVPRKNTGTEDVKRSAIPINDPIVTFTGGYTPPAPNALAGGYPVWLETFTSGTSYTVTDPGGTVIATCTLGSPCATSEINFEIDPDTASSAPVAATAGDLFYLHYEPTPGIYFGGVSINQTTTNNHKDFFFYPLRLNITAFAGDAIEMNGSLFGGNIYALHNSLTGNGGYGYETFGDYDDSWDETNNYSNGMGGWYLWNTASLNFFRDNTYGNYGYSWDIEDTHGNAGPIGISYSEINQSRFGGIRDNQTGGDRTFLDHDNIGFNSKGSPGVYPDISAGLGLQADGLVVTNSYFKRTADPDGSSSNVSSMNFTCDTGFSGSILVDAGTRLPGGQPSVGAACLMDWAGADALTGYFLTSSDAVLNGAQSGVGGFAGPMVDIFGNGSMQVPHGTTNNRPDSGTTPWQIRGNTITNMIESSGSGGSWRNLVYADNPIFTGNGLTVPIYSTSPGSTLTPGMLGYNTGTGRLEAGNGTATPYNFVRTSGDTMAGALNLSAGSTTPTDSTVCDNSTTIANGAFVNACAASVTGMLPCVTTLAVTGTNVTLTVAQARCMGVVVTGTETAAVQLIYPTGAGMIFTPKIENETTAGSFNLQAKVNGGGSAVVIPPATSPPAPVTTSITCDGISSLLCFKS